MSKKKKPKSSSLQKTWIWVFLVSFLPVFISFVIMFVFVLQEFGGFNDKQIEKLLITQPVGMSCFYFSVFIVAIPTITVLTIDIYRFFERRDKKKRAEDYDEKEYANVLWQMPYERGWLMTIPEKNFWLVLKNTVDKDKYIVIKPSLKEFVKVSDYGKNNINRRAWRELAQKHVDFLVCSKNNMYPLYAIEYDGDTHNPNDPVNIATIRNDQFKDYLFRSIGMPLIRVPYGNWTVESLKEYIDTSFSRES